MAYIFPKKTTYNTPEGDYSAKVREAFLMPDGKLRIVFHVTSLNHKLLTYLAGKNYSEGKQTLADDLIEWLGEETTQTLVHEDGAIDYQKLKGLSADIRIEHISNDEYEKPYVFVSKIRPAGSLVNNLDPEPA